MHHIFGVFCIENQLHTKYNKNILNLEHDQMINTIKVRKMQPGKLYSLVSSHYYNFKSSSQGNIFINNKKKTN